MSNDDSFIEAAFNEARIGLSEGGIPIGCVIVRDSEIVGSGRNRRVQTGSVVLHGEMDALENTGRQSVNFYRECSLFTTLSPCSMCAGAILLYRVPRVVIGDNKSFVGEESWLRERGVSVEVLNDPTCVSMMKEFMAAQPQLWAEDIGELAS